MLGIKEWVLDIQYGDMLEMLLGCRWEISMIAVINT